MMPGTRLATDVCSKPSSLRPVRNVRRRRAAHPSTGGQSVPEKPHLLSTTSQPVHDNLSNPSVISHLAARGDDDSMDTGPDLISNGPEVNAEKWFHDSNRNVSNNWNMKFDDRESELDRLLSAQS